MTARCRDAQEREDLSCEHRVLMLGMEIPAHCR